MAKVATGTPAGICTMESSESSPWRCRLGHRHAEHRKRGLGREHARQVRGAARAGDDAAEPASRRLLRVAEEQVGRAVGARRPAPRAARRTPRSRRAACCMTSQSESLPITTPTSGRSPWSPRCASRGSAPGRQAKNARAAAVRQAAARVTAFTVTGLARAGRSDETAVQSWSGAVPSAGPCSPPSGGAAGPRACWIIESLTSGLPRRAADAWSPTWWASTRRASRCWSAYQTGGLQPLAATLPGLARRSSSEPRCMGGRRAARRQEFTPDASRASIPAAR